MPANKTLVIQSHRKPLPYQWLTPCLKSVKQWAHQNKFEYLFIGDEIFDSIPEKLIQKTQNQKIIATDLARLHTLQYFLQLDYTTVVWCDADFLIFDPDNFHLPQSSYAVGREVWVQHDNREKLRAYRKVHNAFLMFQAGNSFLDFYIDTAERLLSMNTGSMPPQFIGPKLLTALHNIIQCPVLETAGMLSPFVMKDLIAGSGKSLQLFRDKSPMIIAAANLCSSLTSAHSSEKDIEIIIHTLLLKKGTIFSIPQPTIIIKKN